MHRFVVEGELTPGSELTLSSEESHHLARVVRVKVGETIELTDGDGHLATATVTDDSPRASRARVTHVQTRRERSLVTVCFAIPKGAALEFLVRRTAEIGVAGFQPLVTRHSIKPDEWNEKRWARIIHEVAKQCQELHFPRMAAPLKLETWLMGRDSRRALVFCDEAERAGGSDIPVGSPGVDLLVGAEGGWSREESERVRSSGALTLGLGRNRLRAEMAAVVGTVLVKKAVGEI